MKKLVLILIVNILAAFSVYPFFGLFQPDAVKNDGLYAVFHTTHGKIYCELYFEKTPVTVANFVGLAEGSIEFADPQTGRKSKKKFYDGLTFHRIIKGFVIQGGCPLGNGTGGPGYKFPDEFDSSLQHSGAGFLSMANSGPNTNGSQFFITLGATPHLNNKHSIFGKVISGHDVMEKIAEVKTDNTYNKPYKDVYINKVEIIRKGKKAVDFDALKEFEKKDQLIAKQNELNKKRLNDLLIGLGVSSSQLTKTQSGLEYFIMKSGKGKTPNKGDVVSAHYSGYLVDGTVFDSSYSRNVPIEFPAGVNRVIAGWDETLLTMKEGEKRLVVIPYYLAYGVDGRPPHIPAMATLVFEVELLKVK